MSNIFTKWKNKWKVSWWNFSLIILTFAITGTTTAYLTRKITFFLGLTTETFWLWKVCLRLGMLIFGYQILILLISIPFGQFRFFYNYEKKILKRMKQLFYFKSKNEKK